MSATTAPFRPPEGYPNRFTLGGEAYVFVRETDWLRKFVSEHGRKLVISRLIDGSFDRDVFERVAIQNLGERERAEVGLALFLAPLESLPEEWRHIRTEFEKWSREQM